MKSVSFENIIKQWSFYTMDKKDDLVLTGKLLNENKTESLGDKSTYENDWLLFSLKENNTTIKPLQ